MALAKFFSIKGDKKTSALLIVKTNPLEYSGTPVYVPLAGAEHFAGKKLTDEDKDFEFEIPDGFRLESIYDIETGAPYTSKDGQELKQLVY